MKIFFNDSCSICRSEINIYKKQGLKQLEWVDITNNKNAEKDTQKTSKDLLRRLHVKTDGKMEAAKWPLRHLCCETAIFESQEAVCT